MKEAVETLHSRNLKTIMNYYSIKSGKKFAEMIGVSQSEISQILRGRRHISPAMAWEIIKFNRNISIYWILEGEGEMLINQKEYPERDAEPLVAMEDIDGVVYVPMQKVLGSGPTAIARLAATVDELRKEVEELRERLADSEK
jgi:transcriptional regulator with XRE-family HTH domain